MEEAVNKVVSYLQQHGKATWKELLERLGIPKVTLYRALKKLEGSGIVRKDSRGLYVLVDKAFVALVPTYAKQVCELIECDNVERLTADLMKMGKSIEVIESARISFVERYTETIKSLGILSLVENLFKGFYSHRGFFTILLYELSKVMKGLEVISSCDRCEAFTVCPKLRDVVKSMDYPKSMGIPREAFEEALKVGEVLKGHGYKGVIRITLLGVGTELSFRELILLTVSQLPILPTEVLKLYTFLVQLAFSYYETGCRPLGEKELEELKSICTILSSS